MITYIFNDLIVHSSEISTIFKYWGWAIVVSIFIYISCRFFRAKPKNKAWYQALLVYIFWIIIELLYSQRFGLYPNQLGVKNSHCYEIIIHINLWICLYILFYLQPYLKDDTSNQFHIEKKN